jgi:hypothetical protein
MLVTATIAINLLDMTNPPSHRAGWSPTHSPFQAMKSNGVVPFGGSRPGGLVLPGYA